MGRIDTQRVEAAGAGRAGRLALAWLLPVLLGLAGAGAAPADSAAAVGIPSTAWAGPHYAGGTVRVLLFLLEPAYRFRTRLATELQRAGDFSVDWVRGCDYPRQFDLAAARRLLRGSRYDVFVLLSYRDWECAFDDLLPEDVRATVLDQVRAGAGLLVTDRAPESLLAVAQADPDSPGERVFAGLPLTGRFARDAEHWKGVQRLREPPAEADFRNAFVESRRLGAGRLVRLRHRLVLNGDWRHPRLAADASAEQRVDAEYAMAELVRLVLAAAGRLPAVTPVLEPPVPWRVLWSEAGQPGLEARWRFRQALTPPVALQAGWRLRDLAGTVLVTGESRLPAEPESDLAVRLPPLGSGRYGLDVWLDSDRGRETYACAALEVEPQVEVRLEEFPELVAPGQALAGRVAVEGPSPAGTAAHVLLLDPQDRVLVRQPLPVGGSPVAVEVPLPPGPALQVRVAVEVRAAGRRLGWASTAVHIEPAAAHTFHMVVTGAPDGEYGYWGLQALARTGVTAASAEGDPAAAGLLAAPLLMEHAFRGELGGVAFAGFRAEVDEATGVMRPCCWNDTPRLRQYLGPLRDLLDDGRAVPALAQVLYRDGPLRGDCLHAACLGAYRAWLRSEYGDDLARLNRAWHSAYGAWDDVAPLRPGDVDESEARARGDARRWADRWRFGYANLARTVLAQTRQLADRYAPGSKLALPSPVEFGTDVEPLLDAVDIVCTGTDLGADLVRSLRRPGSGHGVWLDRPGQGTEERVRAGWEAVLLGADSLWWRAARATGRQPGWLAADLQSDPETRPLIESLVLPLRQGLGDLLANLERRHDGVALYEDPADVLESAALADPRPDRRHPAPASAAVAHGAWRASLREAGLQWVYLSRRQLVGGHARERGLRVVILAGQDSLDPAERQALAEFAQAGGTVLADRLPTPAADEPPADPTADSVAALFGAQRRAAPDPRRLPQDVTFRLADGEVTLAAGVAADASMAAGTAQPATTVAGLPLGLTRAAGRGRFVLLNADLADPAPAGTAEPGRAVRGLPALLGLSPRLDLLPTGAPLRQWRMATWQTGGVTIHGLLVDGGPEPRDLRVRLPAAGTVWRIGHGPLGRTADVSLPGVRSGRAEFLAVLPYDPGEIEATAATPTATRGQTTAVTVRLSGVPEVETGWFTYRLRLLGPDGAATGTLPWAVGAAGGRLTVPVHMAWNDPAGDWRLELRETTTGRTAETLLRLPAATPEP